MRQGKTRIRQLGKRRTVTAKDATGEQERRQRWSRQVGAGNDGRGGSGGGWVQLALDAEAATGNLVACGEVQLVMGRGGAVGETCESLCVCVYYFILIILIHLLFILVDHRF